MARLLALLVPLLLVAGPAEAATFCVGVAGTGCVAQPSLDAALDAAAEEPGLDTIRVGRQSEPGPVADAAGEPVRIVGSGRRATEIAGRVDLGEDGSSLAALTVRSPTGTALALRGDGRDLQVEGGVRLRDGAELRSSAITGPVVTAGRVRTHSVAVAGTGLEVESGSLTAAHLTLYGTSAVGLRIAPGAEATLSNSLVWGFARGLDRHGDRDVLASCRRAGSTRCCSGRRATCACRRARRWSTPATRSRSPPTSRRPMRPATCGPWTATVTAPRGATSGRSSAARCRRPRRPATCWPTRAPSRASRRPTTARRPRRRAGAAAAAFTSVRYGTTVGLVAFPTAGAASVLGAGDAFFAGGPGTTGASATQVVDVSGWAPEIDARVGFRVRLSALLGGYRLSEDHAVVSARFRGPAGIGLGGVTLDTVTAAERGNATMLMPRTARAVVPRLTRTIAVTVRTAPPGGSYDDGYADDVALVPAVPPLSGVPRRRTRAGRIFGGVSVLSRRVRVRGTRARVRVGCPTATVQRCAGLLTLARRRSVVLATRQISLRPGELQRVRFPLSRRERRELRRPQRGHVYWAVRDGQGQTRSATAPVRIVRR